ncbi:hypothetical protein RFI_27686, partial [Reticulomyxa filosa]
MSDRITFQNGQQSGEYGLFEGPFEGILDMRPDSSAPVKNENNDAGGLPNPIFDSDEEDVEDSPPVPDHAQSLDAPPTELKENEFLMESDPVTQNSGGIEAKPAYYFSDNLNGVNAGGNEMVYSSNISNGNVSSSNQSVNSNSNNNVGTNKGIQINDVDFTHLLRQVDVGIEKMEQVKEIIRKFSKHQLQDATKLLEVLDRYPAKYLDANGDGMKEFAQCCDLTQTLIIETTRAQRRLAEYLANKIVPTMNKYIQ